MQLKETTEKWKNSMETIKKSLNPDIQLDNLVRIADIMPKLNPEAEGINFVPLCRKA